MTLRNFVPPPGVALAPNVAPGREFWNNREGWDADDPHLPPIAPADVDLSKPNLTRLGLADQLCAQNIAAGQDAATARVNAEARALVMIP